MIKKYFTIFTLAIFLLAGIVPLQSNNVFAAENDQLTATILDTYTELGEIKGLSDSTAWNISFPSPIDKNSINKDTIGVFDMTNNVPISTNLTVSSDSKTVTVSLPEGVRYQNGSKYCLYIKSISYKRTFTIGQASVKQVQEGTITVTDNGNVKIHTYTSPADGYFVSSQIIETPQKLVIVDVQVDAKFAGELKAYAEKSGKPIDRVIITHGHSDHWAGAELFKNYPIYALPEVRKEIEENKEEGGDKAAAFIKNVITEGTQTIDGINFNFVKKQGGESTVSLVVKLPEQKILVAQDFVHNKVHLFTLREDFAKWTEVLNEFEKENYKTVLPGHGVPGGSKLITKEKEYIETTKELMTTSKTSDEFVAGLFKKYPGYGNEGLVKDVLAPNLVKQNNVQDIFSLIEKNDIAQLSTAITSSNINTKKDGLTPLMFANKLKNLEAVKLLVSKGADLEAKGTQYESTVLIQASEQENIEIMKYLVENKADIEALDVDGGSPLDCAGFEGKTESIKYLVSVGANKNHQGPVWGNTALILASMNGHIDTVKYLLSIDASATLKNKKGVTAYDVAKTPEIKELLASYNK